MRKKKVLRKDALMYKLAMQGKFKKAEKIKPLKNPDNTRSKELPGSKDQIRGRDQL